MPNDFTSKFKVDISDLKANISEAQKQIKTANATFKAETAGMDKWSEDATGLAKKLEQLKTVLESQKNILSSYEQQMQRQQAAYDENGRRADELREKLKRLASEGVDKASDEYKKLESELTKVEAEQRKNQSAVDSLKDKILNQKAAVSDTEKQLYHYVEAQNKMEQEARSVTHTVEEQEKKLKELRQQYIDTVAAEGKHSASAEKLAKEIKSLSGELDENKSALADAEKEADNLTESYDEAEKSAGNLADKLAGGLKTALGAVAAGLAAVATATIALGKQAIESYAEYEQLVGGVETLFKDSSDLVVEYANNAYKTAGLSANEYMETVTSFSASLLQSLNGDTEKAAGIADRAITDMSDNANKMGTAMSSLQTAYAGFAKGNFTMLDNLKLGYGGTKTEMERLIADAAKMTEIQEELGVKIDKGSLSFANIVNAISVMQSSLDITGTTAREASTTIQGSIGAMQSAWDNLMTGMADDTMNLGDLMDNLADSVMTVLDNILPRVSIFVDKLGDFVGKMIDEVLPKTAEQMLPTIIKLGGKIIESFIKILESSVPKIFDGAMKALSGISEALKKFIPEFAKKIPEIIDKLVNYLKAAVPVVLDAMKNVLAGITEAIRVYLPELAKKVPEIIDTIVDLLAEALPTVIDAAVTLLSGILQAIPQIISALTKDLPKIITKIVETLKTSLPMVLEAALQLFGEIIKAIPQIVVELGKSMPSIITAITSALYNSVAEVATAAADVFFQVEKGAKQSADHLKETANSIKGYSDNLLSDSQTQLESYVGFVSSSGKTIGDVETEIKRIEGEITTVIKNAISDRGVLYTEDLLQIANYNKQLKELQKEKLEILSAQQLAELSIIKAEAASITPEEAAQYVDRAKTALDNAKRALFEGYAMDMTYAEIEKKYNADLTDFEYKQLTVAAKYDYNKAVENAEGIYADALEVLSNSAAQWVTDDVSVMWQDVANRTKALDAFVGKDNTISNLSGGLNSYRMVTEDVLSMWDSISPDTLKSTQAFLNMQAQLVSNGRELSEEMKGAVDVILDVFDSLPSGMAADAGKDLLEGIVSGMENYLPQLENSADMTAHDIVGTIRDAFEIPRYKQVLQETGEEIVEDIGDGIDLGLDDGSASLRRALNRVGATIDEATGLIVGGNAETGAGGSTNSNTTNYTQIINAPKSPSRIEIYRDTQNLLDLASAN